MPATTDDPFLPFSLPSIGQKKVSAAFDGGLISSDGGVLLLAGADKRLGLIDMLAAIIPDHRDQALITHPMSDILRGRVFAIACGYPDADDLDDLDDLRKDPAFKLACGRLPQSGDDLHSQLTMSRWENAPDLRTLIRMTRAMVDLWCKSHARPPKAITLDIDAAADTVHGEAGQGSSGEADGIVRRGHQQLSLFTAHYDERCFLPIHIYDAATGHCIVTILRPGKTPDGKEVRAHLRRLVRRIRMHWPKTVITIRGDGHYGRREAMEWCEKNSIQYVFGLSKNPTLDALIYTKADEVRTRRAKGKLELVRDYTETLYAAKSWTHPRRVVARFEATQKGFDTRYVVTNITHCGAQWLYDSLYCMRGAAENLIKRHKSHLASDRTVAARPSNATDPAYGGLLADAQSPECHPPAAAAGQRRVLHDPPAVAEDRGADQADREPGPAGVRLQLPGRGAVPRTARCAEPAPDVNGGASAPVNPAPINPSRLPDMV